MRQQHQYNNTCVLYHCVQLKKKFVGPKGDIQYSIDENWKQYLPQDCKVDFGDSILKEIGRMKMKTDSTGELQ